MSHDAGRRDSCGSTRRDGRWRWLWRLVRLVLHGMTSFVFSRSETMGTLIATLAGEPRLVGGSKRHFFTDSMEAQPISGLVACTTATSATLPSSWIVSAIVAC